MRVATAADLRGAGRTMLLALLRASFRDGRDLGDADALRAVVEEAAPAAGLDARQLLDASTDDAVKARLRERTEEAIARGVFGVPTVVIDGEVYWGDDRLEQAAAH
jgi:2-hydroxychromene-2-carboxylate isomerase